MIAQTFRQQWEPHADHVQAVSRVATWYDGTAQRLRLSYHVDAGEAWFLLRGAYCWQRFALLRWGRGGRVMAPAEAERRARAWLAAESQRRFGASPALNMVAWNQVGVRRSGRVRTVLEV